MARWPSRVLPALAEVSEVGQHDIPQDGRQGQIGQEPVQHGLRGRLIESVQWPAGAWRRAHSLRTR